MYSRDVAQARQRIVGGITIGEPLGETGYGSTFRATSAARRDLIALVIDSAQATHAGFRAVLLDPLRRERLLGFTSAAAVGTIAVAEAGSDLVVVTLGGRDARSVAELLRWCSGCRPKGGAAAGSGKAERCKTLTPQGALRMQN